MSINISICVFRDSFLGYCLGVDAPGTLFDLLDHPRFSCRMLVKKFILRAPSPMDHQLQVTVRPAESSGDRDKGTAPSPDRNRYGTIEMMLGVTMAQLRPKLRQANCQRPFERVSPNAKSSSVFWRVRVGHKLNRNGEARTPRFQLAEKGRSFMRSEYTFRRAGEKQ